MGNERAQHSRIVRAVRYTATVLLAGVAWTWLSTWAIASYVVNHQGISTTPTLLGDGSVAWAGSSRAFGSESWLTSPADEAMHSQARRDKPEPPSWAKARSPSGHALSIARGWPLRCLWCQADTSTPGVIPAPNGAVVVKSRLVHGGRAVLPYWVLGRGLVLNTLFWSLWMGSAWGAFVLVRRHRWRVRGRCLSCGYSRDGLNPGAACPECGGVAGDRVDAI